MDKAVIKACFKGYDVSNWQLITFLRCILFLDHKTRPRKLSLSPYLFYFIFSIYFYLIFQFQPRYRTTIKVLLIRLDRRVQKYEKSDPGCDVSIFCMSIASNKVIFVQKYHNCMSRMFYYCKSCSRFSFHSFSCS
jgi:hypothetical protein